MRLRTVAVVLAAGAVLGGCGSADEQAPATGGAAMEQTEPAPAREGCPLTADELSEATALTWVLEETREHHPLETMESVEVTACLYTAAEAEQEGGDPLVARVDVVAPADAAAVAADFSSTCTEFGGTERAAGGGTVCDRDGTVVDGHIGDLVVVSIVNADQDTAAALSPSFEQVLASAG